MVLSGTAGVVGLFDPWIAGVGLPVLIAVGLMLIPFLDVNKKGKGYYTFSERKFAITSYSFGMALWLVLIVIGVWFRGLDWNWYWPWENGISISRRRQDLKTSQSYLQGPLASVSLPERRYLIF